ncbi:ArnT family glycosyltransferase [Ktedonobacter racemifer]|uniref:Glycosyl transferase family 39 n=1 Tax=Ktedonobacter racemifer DSM 44963 TaxID=485913 RepID=D6TBL6_KTERA|nr:glycosyltransferase family 39 protein [Ktedonobacter racemifer]EFH88000.1 glycosyl transferase family 39 [Ktedonobacter racemifer DSM 44963]
MHIMAPTKRVPLVKGGTPLSQHQSYTRFYTLVSYLLMLTFVLGQLYLIFTQRTGAFYDEAIYITAGLRAWQGKGVSDGYLVWFAGSLLWPLMAGIGYLLNGLIGVRIIALLLSSIALWMSYATAKNLFGVKAACFTALLLILDGNFLALAHLGVYDSPALAFTAISLWCVTQLQKKDHRAWLCLSAIALALAAMSKYPITLMILPILGLLFTFRQKKFLADLGVFLFVFVGVFFAFFLPVQYQVGDWLFWSIRNKPTFGATMLTIVGAQLYFGLASFILAFLGFLLAPRKKEALVLLLCGLIWPAYHILSSNPVSDNKHVVFGFLFTYPLLGLFFAQVWQKKWFGKPLIGLLCLACTYIGVFQYMVLDPSWPDVREPSAYLVAHTRPGDLLLINDAWPYTMYLYANQKIATPWQVYDNNRISNHENTTSICNFTWYIDEKGSYPWSETFLKQLRACHTFVPVYHYTSNAIGLTSDLHYVQYPVVTTIYINVHANR